MDDSNYLNYDINNHQTYDTLTSQLIEPTQQYNQCEVRLETFDQAFKSHALMLNDDRNRPNPIECDVCKKSFTLIQHLRIHMHIHNDEKKFQCELCPEQFVLETDLTNHMKQHSDNYKPFKCKICGQAYSHERNLKVHQQVHTNNVMFKCDQCDKVSKLRQTPYWNTKTQFFLLFYFKEFNQMFSLKIHMNVHNNKPYKCSLCEKTFSQSSNLKNHLNVHNGHRPHKCDVCGKGEWVH